MVCSLSPRVRDTPLAGTGGTHSGANSEGVLSLHPLPKRRFRGLLHTECSSHVEQKVQVSSGMQLYQEQSRLHQGRKDHFRELGKTMRSKTLSARRTRSQARGVPVELPGSRGLERYR
jgi:hypothetical protein